MYEDTCEHRLHRFGDFELDPGRERLTRDGEAVSLRHQSFTVLVYLVERQGQLVTRDELMDRLWPGKVVTDDSLTQCLMDIRLAIGDDQRHRIQTVPKRGYVFNAEAAGTGAGSAGGHNPRRRLAGLAALAVVSFALVAAFRLYGPEEPQIESPPTIVVLPFNVLGSGGDDLAFGDGIRAEVARRMGTTEGLRLIATATADEFSDSPVDLEQLRRTTGAGYALGGTVQRAGGSFRSNFWLIDTTSGVQLWAEAFDRALSVENVFELQDELARSITHAIGTTLDVTHQGVLGESGPGNMAALENYFDGLYLLRQIEIGDLETEPLYEPAIAEFEASIGADPEWAPAHAALGRLWHFRVRHGMREQVLAESTRHILKALEINPDYAPAWDSLGFIYTALGKLELASDAFKRMRELGVHASWAYAIYQMRIGNFEAAIQSFSTSLAHDPLSQRMRQQLSMAYLCAGHYRELIEANSNQLESRPDDTWLHWSLAFGWGILGDTDRSQEYTSRYLELGGDRLRLAPIYIAVGEYSEAAEILESAEAAGTLDPLDAVYFATATGNIDAAISTLEEEVEDPSSEMYFMDCGPHRDVLRNDQRYVRLRAQLGYPLKGNEASNIEDDLGILAPSGAGARKSASVPANWRNSPVCTRS